MCFLRLSLEVRSLSSLNYSIKLFLQGLSQVQICFLLINSERRALNLEKLRKHFLPGEDSP